MTKIYLLLGSIILFYGCFICPKSNKIKFDKENLIIRVESKNYFIDYIQISEFEQGKLIDSTRVKIISTEEIGDIKIKIDSIPRTYLVDGSLDALLAKENLRYEVQIKKFNPSLGKNALNPDVIYFSLLEMGDEVIKQFNSKHNCP